MTGEENDSDFDPDLKKKQFGRKFVRYLKSLKVLIMNT